MKKTIIVFAALALILTGCAAPVTEPSPPIPETVAPTPTPEPETEKGSYTNPYSHGATITFFSDDETTDFDVSLKVIDWDAEAALKKVNRFNDGAKSGMKLMLAEVTVTNNGQVPLDVSDVYWNVEFLDSTNTARQPVVAVTEKSYIDLGDVYPGGTTEFHMVFSVKDNTTSGMWILSITKDPGYILVDH